MVIVPERRIVKRVLGRIIALAVTGSLLACAPSEEGSDPGTIRVVAPMSDSHANYKLEPTILTGVEDLQTLRGQYANFFISPKIENNKLVGDAPRTRFIKNSEGDFIPGNSLTQQMVAIYAHLEKLARLDIELGAVGVNTWPRDVGVAVKVRGGNDNNAFYDGKSDSMLFVPYNQEGLAIPINGGIIAHEHFHSLFYKIVLKDTQYRINAHDVSTYYATETSPEIQPEAQPETQQQTRGPRSSRRLDPVVSRPPLRSTIKENDVHRYYHIVIARAMNEGLADFWGWMYTGDPDFIAQSLPKQKLNRSLEEGEALGLEIHPCESDIMDADALPCESQVKRFLNVYYSFSSPQDMNAYAVGHAYKVASSYSRVVKKFTDIYAKARSIPSLEARKEVAKVLVKTLPLIQKDLISLDQRYYKAEDFLKGLISQLDELKETECEYIQLVLNKSHDDKSFSCSQENNKWTLQEEEIKLSMDLSTSQMSNSSESK